MENEELYRRAQAGEAGAFEQLHKQLANFIRSIALESCRHFGCTDVVSASLLEDLCAEGDLELWERIHSGGYDEHAGKLPIAIRFCEEECTAIWRLIWE